MSVKLEDSGIWSRPRAVTARHLRPSPNGTRTRWSSTQQPYTLAIIFLCMLVAIVPALRIILIVAGTGQDTLSDDLVFYAHAVDLMLAGKYVWTNLFHDSYVTGSHSLALVFLIHFLDAKYLNWNIYAEMYLGIAASALKVLLLYSAFTRQVGGRYRWILLPVLSALVFSPSQINTYGYEDASLTTTIPQLLLGCGMWAVIRFREKPTGIAIASVTAAISCWAGAVGLPVCLVLLVEMWLLGYRKAWTYATVFLGGCIGFAPYVYYHVFRMPPWQQLWTQLLFQPAHAHLTLNIAYVIAAVGLPFAPRNAGLLCIAAGFAGWALALTATRLCFRAGAASLARLAAAPFAFSLYAVCNILIIGSARGWLAPWYDAHFMPFWIGLAGLAYVFVSQFRGSRAAQVWALMFAGVLSGLYVTTNIAFSDKVFYLYTHSPASAACLRAYAATPPGCEQRLDSWSPGTSWPALTALGSVLNRWHLSVLGADRTYTLQGDFALPSVRAHFISTDMIRWTEPGGLVPASYTSYDHLDLLLRSGNTVWWRVHLPSGTTEGKLSFALQAPLATPHPALDLTVATSGRNPFSGLRRTIPSDGSWQPVALDLRRFAGNTITVALAVRSQMRPRFVALRYPTIHIHMDTRHNDMDSSLYAWERPRASAPISLTWRSREQPVLTNITALNTCLSGYRSLTFRERLDSSLWPRAARITLLERDGTSRRRHRQYLYLPLALDGGNHDYTYDLKLLAPLPTTRVVGVSIQPAYGATMSNVRFAHVDRLRLDSATNPIHCGE